MEQLTCLSTLFRPLVIVDSTTDADAVVRTYGEGENVANLLSRLGACRFERRETITPLTWPDAVGRLENALNEPNFARDYRAQIERCAATAPHDFFATPLLCVVALWVGEKDLLAKLIDFTHANISAPIHVVLVTRIGKRQDDAATEMALRKAKMSKQKVAAVHILKLGDGDDLEVIHALQAAIEDELLRRTGKFFDAYTRLKRATRSTFSAWFRHPTVSAPSMNNELNVGENTVETTSSSFISKNSQLQQRQRKRNAFAGDDDDTPLFDPECYEAVTRHLADLLTLAGRFSEASDLYRTLASDFKSLNGPARTHAAAAAEMFGITAALAGNSIAEHARNTESAVVAYTDAGRPELAVRAALRAADACEEVKKPKFSASVLSIAAATIRGSASLSGTPGSFIDAASGVLHARAATALSYVGKRRRAALHAFLAAGRLGKIGMTVAAAACVRHVDEKALVWPGVAAEYDLVVGLADLDDGSAVNAVRHFIQVLCEAKDDADVEVQSFIVRQLTTAVGKGAVDKMKKNWVDGALFPLLVVEDTKVDTVDSLGSVERSESAHDEVLKDFEYFESARKARCQDVALPERERPVEDVVAELRKLKDSKDRDLGGSLENKIRRMRERDGVVRKRRRARSLLQGCAAVGEPVRVTVTLKNPLHFPVFVNRLAPVVTLQGKTYTANCEGVENTVVFEQQEEIVLGPRSVQSVVLCVVAKQTGVLRIVGAQWLFTIGMGDQRAIATSQIPGYAEITRRGRRLNDERMHRCSEVPMYAVDTTLQVEVTEPAPRIRVIVDEFVDQEIWRNGEMRLMTMSFLNEGAVKAEGIVCRSDTPQSVFVPVSGDDALVIGMDGQLMGSKGAAVAAYFPVSIEPGKQVKQSFWVRASVSQAIMQSAFGKGRAKKEVSKFPECRCALTLAYGMSKPRVATWNGAILVRPSLGVSRRFLTWANRENDAAFILGVEVEHSTHGAGDAPVYEVAFVGMTCKSGWAMRALPETERTIDGESKVVENKLATLRVNETATLFSKVVKGERSEKASVLAKAMGGGTGEWETSVVEMKTQVDTAFQLATQHFVVANQVRSRKWAKCALVAVSWRNSELCRGALFLSPIDLTRYAAAAGGSRPGSALATRSNSYASLTGVAMEVPASEMVEAVDEEPVVVTLKHENRILHDFESGPAVVPVDVYVRNATTRLVDVSITAAPHEEIADGCRGRYWTGDINMSLRALPPDAQRFVQLTAVLERPGSYDMAKVSVRWQIMNHAAAKKIAVVLRPSFVLVERLVGGGESSGALPNIDTLKIGARGSVDMEEDLVMRARKGLRR